jgi:hypothetical protein
MDCVEAIFSEDPVHLTVGSVPPGNGFALGVVAEKPVHFVSPFAPEVIPDMRNKTPFPEPADPDTGEKTDRGGYKSLFIPRLGAAVSTNGSWYVSGNGDWLPGIYKNGIRTLAPIRPGLPPRKKNCHEFLSLCTEQVLAVHFQGAHRVARTINFFGIGPGSPPLKSTFRMDETYGGVEARLPISDEFTVLAGVEARVPEVPAETQANSVFNLNPALVPGVNSRPFYIHSKLGLAWQKRQIFEARTAENDTPNEQLPLLKHRTAMTADGAFAYHWYEDASASNASFQQLRADAGLAFELGAVTQKYVISTSISGLWRRAFYRVIQHYCGGPPADPRIVVNREADAKKREAEIKEQKAERKKNKIAFEIKHDDYCDFGTVNLRSHLATSTASTGDVIPFFMLPSVGGQDIDSRISLRGFENYRFRGPDITFFQAEYTAPIYDPLGLLLFYDAGNAGNKLGDLSFAHLRQDAGFGINIRIMRMPVAQVYLSGGRGGGIHPGFNLVKQF